MAIIIFKVRGWFSELAVILSSPHSDSTFTTSEESHQLCNSRGESREVHHHREEKPGCCYHQKAREKREVKR